MGAYQAQREKVAILTPGRAARVWSLNLTKTKIQKMNKIVIVILTLFANCCNKSQIADGIYHYSDPKVTYGFMTKTIRIKPDKTFYLIGVKSNYNTVDSLKSDKDKYYNVIAYGDWKISGKYLILKSNIEYLNHWQAHFMLEDTIYNQAEFAYYPTIVPNLKGDSLLIKNDEGVIVEVSSGIELSYLKK